MNKKKKLLIVGGIVAILLLMIIPEEPLGLIKGEWDISKQVEAEGLDIYLKEESDFDYSHPEIYEVAQKIKARTSTPRQAVKETLNFVVSNVRYSSGISVTYCYEEKASTVLRTGVGDCVSMTRLTVSLLRAQGIPARSVGGCLSFLTRCIPTFVAVPFLQARVTEMVEDDFKKRGYLHEWLEFWLPENGGTWFLAESTSSQVFDITPPCKAYLTYAYDTNRFDRCVVSSQGFWQTCRNY